MACNACFIFGCSFFLLSLLGFVALEIFGGFRKLRIFVDDIFEFIASLLRFSSLLLI